jgi:hypothetical protein
VRIAYCISVDGTDRKRITKYEWYNNSFCKQKIKDKKAGMKMVVKLEIRAFFTNICYESLSNGNFLSIRDEFVKGVEYLPLANRDNRIWATKWSRSYPPPGGDTFCLGSNF